MKLILVILLITVLLFAGTVVWFNFHDKQVQDSLINMFLGMCATELVAMGGIKAFKLRYQRKNKDDR